jgi:hypothetical protein
MEHSSTTLPPDDDDDDDDAAEVEVNLAGKPISVVGVCFSLLTTIFCIGLFSSCLFGGLWFFTDYLPSQKECNRGYQFHAIERWMEGDDAQYFWPTLKEAMEDGVLQNYEYEKLDQINDNLDLERGRTSFMKLYNERKDHWEKGYFGDPLYLPENTEGAI